MYQCLIHQVSFFVESNVKTLTAYMQDQVIYALHIARNAIGAVFYDGGSRTLSVMEDVPQTDLKSDIEQRKRLTYVVLDMAPV